MKTFYLTLRALILWAVSGLHFFVICTLLVLLGTFVDPRKNDRSQRWFFRNILRVAGVDFEVHRAHGFQPARTSIFICNHVNVFDAFVIYSAIPQFVRGFELESHFTIPAYGWMMKRFGNVPVPDSNSRAGLEEMIRRSKEALDSGVSLIAFAEGSRTRNGNVGPFKKGIFSIAQKFGTPIAPMSIVGSYEFHRTGGWMLYPGKITVYLHDTIETNNLRRDQIDELRLRVQEIVSKPVEELMLKKRTTAEG